MLKFFSKEAAVYINSTKAVSLQCVIQIFEPIFVLFCPKIIIFETGFFGVFFGENIHLLLDLGVALKFTQWT
jgi:hypothetical protein